MKTKHSLIVSFSSANFLNGTITWLFFIFLPIYLRQDLVFSEARIGVLISIYSYAMLLSIAPLGYLSDRVSPKRLIQAGVIGKIIYALGISHVHSYSWLQVIQVFGGVAQALTVICLVTLYYKNLRPKDRGKSLGLFGAAGFLGYAAGPMINAVLRNLGFSYSGVFMATAIISGMLLAITFTLLDSQPVPLHPFEYLKDIKRPEVLIMSIVIIGIGIHFGVERKSFSLVLRQEVGMNDAQLAWLFVILGGCNCISTYLIGRWFDRSKKMLYFMGVGILMSGVFQILTPYAQGFGDIVAIRTVHLLGDAIIMFGLNILMASIFPQKRMGGSSGLMFLLRFIGSAIGATAAGILDVRWPAYKASFLISGISILIAGTALVIGYKVMRRVRRTLTKEVEELEAGTEF